MRQNHPCGVCGLELRRIPAPPDPRYGLPVVVCPRCETAVVRRKPRLRPSDAAVRVRRLALAVLARAVLLVLLLLTTAPVVASAGLAGGRGLAGLVGRLRRQWDLAGPRPRDQIAEFVPVVLIALVVVLAGMLLGLAVRHWPRWAIGPGVSCLLAAVWLPPNWVVGNVGVGDGGPAASLVMIAAAGAIVGLGAILMGWLMPDPLQARQPRVRRRLRAERRRLARVRDR